MKKISLILIPFVLIMGCSKSTKEEIKVGALLSLTGDIAEYGQRVKKGVDLAVEEINSSGGINGSKLQIVYEDTKGFAKDGVNGAQKLMTDKSINMIIGPISSSVALAVEPMTSKNKIILFSPAASSPKLTGISKYFFRNWPSDVFEASVLAEYVWNELKIKNAAILSVNNDYGIGLTNEFKKKFEELGGKILLIEQYPQNANDFRFQLTKIQKYKPTAIYLAGYHREMAYATKQIKEMGIKCQILGDGDYGVQELLDLTGSASEGAVFTIPKNDFTDSIALLFKERFNKKYNLEPSVFEANGYDAVYILKQAVMKVGFNTDSISSYIGSLKDYHGAAGFSRSI